VPRGTGGERRHRVLHPGPGLGRAAQAALIDVVRARLPAPAVFPRALPPQRHAGMRALEQRRGLSPLPRGQLRVATRACFCLAHGVSPAVIPGRADRREPGIHNPRPWLWISGALAPLAPRNDGQAFCAMGFQITFALLTRTTPLVPATRLCARVLLFSFPSAPMRGERSAERRKSSVVALSGATVRAS
jgi:hypothetical protein